MYLTICVTAAGVQLSPSLLLDTGSIGRLYNTLGARHSSMQQNSLFGLHQNRRKWRFYKKVCRWQGTKIVCCELQCWHEATTRVTWHWWRQRLWRCMLATGENPNVEKLAWCWTAWASSRRISVCISNGPSSDASLSSRAYSVDTSALSRR